MFSLSQIVHVVVTLFFFFNDTATTEIYTLSLHDALPILCDKRFVGAREWFSRWRRPRSTRHDGATSSSRSPFVRRRRSEEHTSELQSRQYLVCRLLLEKKNNQYILILHYTLDSKL